MISYLTIFYSDRPEVGAGLGLCPDLGPGPAPAVAGRGADGRCLTSSSWAASSPGPTRAAADPPGPASGWGTPSPSPSRTDSSSQSQAALTLPVSVKSESSKPGLPAPAPMEPSESTATSGSLLDHRDHDEEPPHPVTVMVPRPPASRPMLPIVNPSRDMTITPPSEPRGAPIRRPGPRPGVPVSRMRTSSDQQQPLPVGRDDVTVKTT